jgi:hypothetical protein
VQCTPSAGGQTEQSEVMFLFLFCNGGRVGVCGGGEV